MIREFAAEKADLLATDLSCCSEFSLKRFTHEGQSCVSTKNKQDGLGVYKTWARSWPGPWPALWLTLWSTPNFVILPIMKEKTSYAPKVEGWPPSFSVELIPGLFMARICIH